MISHAFRQRNLISDMIRRKDMYEFLHHSVDIEMGKIFNKRGFMITFTYLI